MTYNFFSLTENRQKLLAKNVRNAPRDVWKFMRKVRKFSNGDNNLNHKFHKALIKIAARLFKESIVFAIDHLSHVIHVNSVAFQPLPHNRDFCIAAIRRYSLTCGRDICWWNVISGRSFFGLSSSIVHVPPVAQIAKFFVPFCSMRRRLNRHDFFACSSPFARNSFPKDEYKSRRR